MFFLSKLFSFLSKIILFTGKIGHGTSFEKPLTAEQEKECFLLMQNKDTQIIAEEKLVKHNLRLVAHIVKKYNTKQFEQDDLVSVGSIGLLKAIRTFDGKSANFSTYASRCIQNEILMLFRATKNQLCEVSLSEPIGTDKDGNEITLEETLSDGGDTVFATVETKLRFDNLKEIMRNQLSDREREVVRLRYGTDGGFCHTQKETAKIMKISRSYISRIETEALQKIRAFQK